MARWRRTSQSSESPAPSTVRGATAQEELQALIDHSRWLLDYHDRRSESINQRAIAVLGFTGVILALVPAALALPKSVEMTRGVWISLIVTMAALLGAAILSVMTFMTRTVGAPGINQAREMLILHTRGDRVGRAHKDLAFNYLFADPMAKPGPVQLAYSAANGRATWFRWSVVVLAGSLVGLASLLTQLALQM